MLKKIKFLLTAIIFFLIIFFFTIVVKSISPNLPKPGQKIILYSNQFRSDLKITFIEALKKAKSSIHLVMFGLTDIQILKNLQKRSDIDVKVYYDPKSSLDDINTYKFKSFKVKSKGLMHQKILVTDQSYVFIGSTNMTLSSLIMHDNMMVGFYSPEIASYLIEKTPYYTGNISTIVSNQEVDLYLLPDIQNKALKKVLDLIKRARSSIKIAMFTLTHQKILDEIINLKKLGIEVTIAIDGKSSRGASKKAIERLKNENIKVLISKNDKLCHHKFMVIDDKILMVGSANWTKSAFDKNNDCFLIVYNLDKNQKSFLKKLWRIIELETL